VCDAMLHTSTIAPEAAMPSMCLGGMQRYFPKGAVT
jgi:hypothetical protein